VIIMHAEPFDALVLTILSRRRAQDRRRLRAGVRRRHHQHSTGAELVLGDGDGSRWQ
jgi:hypothetical protein